VDLRTLSPLDTGAILRSLEHRAHRRRPRCGRPALQAAYYPQPEGIAERLAALL
jgi:hypothetical protein